jgi:hypothetical protein
MIGWGEKECEGTNRKNQTFFKVAYVLDIYKTRPLRPGAEGKFLSPVIQLPVVLIQYWLPNHVQFFSSCGPDRLRPNIRQSNSEMGVLLFESRY